jgi:mono/diheme cytochrome c family protein
LDVSLKCTIRRGLVAVATAISGTVLLAAEQPPTGLPASAPPGPSSYKEAIQPLFKARCVRCHGPNEPEGGLDLSRAATIIQGGDSGAALADTAEESLLWQRVTSGEMPPDRPLSPAEQDVVRGWLTAGMPGLAAAAQAGGGHWAFAPLRMPETPEVLAPADGGSLAPGGERPATGVRTAIDAHLQAALVARQLTLAADADRATLVRRVSFVLTGLPPTPEEVASFVADPAPDAFERLVDRLLESPHYGVHWGKHWLDAAGYADTNGYFGKESDRNHAWQYRDYVVASIAADKPFDRFIREQLAGDELASVAPGATVTPEQRELLVATHFLRNGPDGTDDSAPSPEAQRIDRYAALEAVEQVVYTSLFGLSIKCARCHDHKFEPLTQREYYEAQSIFYPAFNPENWVKPRDRVIRAATGAEQAAWESNRTVVEARLAAARSAHRDWAKRHRPRGRTLFHDESPGSITAGGPWIAAPPGSPAARYDATGLVVDAAADSWLLTSPIEWIAPEIGGAVEVSFDLVSHRAGPGAPASEAFVSILAATDIRGCEPGQSGGGNIAIEGRPQAGPRVYRLRNTNDPEGRRESLGTLGNAAYRPGGTYGVRVTNLGAGKCRLEHLADHAVDGEPLILDHADLPTAPFALARAPDRGIIVANLIVERYPPPPVYRGELLFIDDGTRPVSELWSEAAPGDQPPELAVLLADAVPNRHSADRRSTRLRIVSGMNGPSWLCTQQRFDWTPDVVGQSIQVSFRLVDDAVNLPGSGGRSKPAEQVGYVLGANNFERRRSDAPGNLLVDGGVLGPTQVLRNAPGGPPAVTLGEQRLTPGRRYGVRVTNTGGGVYRLAHLVDDVPEAAPIVLTAADLPDGAFAFLFGDGRSFVVENVIVAAGDLARRDSPEAVARAHRFAAKVKEHRDLTEVLEQELATPAGVEVAWVTDGSPEPPQVFLLRRGLYGEHGDEVTPSGLAVLSDPGHPFEVVPPAGGRSTGRRLALADWMLRPDSRPLALVARVRANWIWLHCFGTGLSTSPENFGLSGIEPSHPELLEFLAAELVRSGWSLKHVLRQVLCSTAFRQSSRPHAAGLTADPVNRLLWRFPLQRLDAESIRDAMLAVSGDLDNAVGGPPVLLQGLDGHGTNGEVEPCETPGRQRRTLYVQRRRNALPTFLQVFDLPGITATCAERPRSTVPLQSLAQLNSTFSRSRAGALADRLITAADDDEARVRLAFTLCTAREPDSADRTAAVAFLEEQREFHAPAADAPRRALVDLCQILFASNAFLYLD